MPLFTVDERDDAVDWLEIYGDLDDGNFVMVLSFTIYFQIIHSFLFIVREFRERIGRAALTHGSPLFQYRLFHVIRLCRLRPTPARTEDMLQCLRRINIVSPDRFEFRYHRLIYMLRCEYMYYLIFS